MDSPCRRWKQTTLPFPLPVPISRPHCACSDRHHLPPPATSAKHKNVLFRIFLAFWQKKKQSKRRFLAPSPPKKKKIPPLRCCTSASCRQKNSGWIEAEERWRHIHQQFTHWQESMHRNVKTKKTQNQTHWHIDTYAQPFVPLETVLPFRLFSKYSCDI